MSKNQASATAVINYPSDAIYAVISDYRNHHAHILPAEYFDGLEVIEGGIGAGTMLKVHAHAFGTKQTLEMAVTEPQPGRVLVEEEVNGGMKTTFTLLPVDDGRTEVTIVTAWPPAGGIQALFNRFMMPRYVRGMLQTELEQIADYMADLQ